jgi:hypothetical protein
MGPGGAATEPRSAREDAGMRGGSGRAGGATFSAAIAYGVKVHGDREAER